MYPYADGDLLVDRNTYFYSPYHGAPFLDAWKARRADIGPASGAGRAFGETPTGQTLADVAQGLLTDDPAAFARLDRLVQRFEVTKRVHDAYGDDWRAVDKTAFRTLPSYVALAEALVVAHERTGRLPYLNCLLKVVDTLQSQAGDLGPDLRARLVTLVAEEARFVEALSQADATGPHDMPPHAPVPAGRAPVALLACESARSRAYLQALVAAGMPPSRVLFMGDERQRDATAPGLWRGIFLPDLGQPVSRTCDLAGIPVQRLDVASVNAPEVQAALAEVPEGVIIYAGFGGQIVSAETLSAGPRFLHMHSGWLPDYRGSTTLYYALLNGAAPGVSAIFLDPGIDTGPILARQTYPVPSAGMDLDLVYDTAIRADLMIRVLARASDPATLTPEALQSPEVGETYYVIHPVLKHVALLSLKPEAP